jgi:hypothetical protein
VHVPSADRPTLRVIVVLFGVTVLIARPTHAQDTAAKGNARSAATTAAPVAGPSSTISCQSQPGSREHCVAETSGGVALVKSSGSTMCLLGKTWGYDDTGVWVADGCSGEFQLGQGRDTSTQPAATEPTKLRIESWGEFEPGDGFLVGRSSKGELAISGYALVRYLNQLPGEQTFTDHSGETRPVDPRNDIWPHRTMVFFKGWLGDPKLIYVITFWTVLDTNQNAIFGNLGYQFSRKFSVYAGLNGNPGTRSLQGSHPFWLGNDRVMADEFFRPFFTAGVWAQGEALPALWYNVMVGDNNSILGVTSSQLDRKFNVQRLDVVDADDEGVRPQRWLRRLGISREAGHSVRLFEHVEPRDARKRYERQSQQHHPQARRQRERVRLGRARARRHRGCRELTDPLAGCGAEVQGHLSADGDLQPLARSLQG